MVFGVCWEGHQKVELLPDDVLAVPIKLDGLLAQTGHELQVGSAGLFAHFAESGLLAPERDSEILANHIETIISDPDLQQRMGLAGRAHVEADYNVVTETRKLEHIYRELIETGALSS